MDPISLSLITQLLPLLSGGASAALSGRTGGKAGGGMSPSSALNPLFGLLQSVPNIYQGAVGIKQLIDARKLEKSTVRPTRSIPGADLEALALSRANAYGVRPGTALAQAALGRNLAGGMSSALQSGGPEGLAAATAMAKNADATAMETAAQQDSWRAGQQQQVLSQLNKIAEQQDQNWDWNKRQPYIDASTKSEQLRDAGYTNVNDSLYGVGGAISSFAGNPLARAARAGNSTASAMSGMAGAGVSSAASNPSSPKDISRGLSIPARRGFRPSRVSGQGEGPANAMPGITKVPYDPNETGIQPTDNTQLTPGTPLKVNTDLAKSRLAFNPQAGSDQTYDFNQVNTDLAKSRLAFNPQAGSGQGYDFNDVASRQPRRVPANPNETGLQPIDNTPVSPGTPSLQARAADQRVARERADFAARALKRRFGRVF